MYIELTDEYNCGDIVKIENNHAYVFRFGEEKWCKCENIYMDPKNNQYKILSENEVPLMINKRRLLLEKLLKLAEETAKRKHKNQYDKAGKPYIEHPRAVASFVDDTEAKITAWLHDIIEDTDTEPDELLNAGFTKRITDTVCTLTHRDGIDYFDYLKSVKTNRLARIVKLADLKHNMDLSRISNPSEKDFLRLKKYEKAKKYLSDS